MKCRSLKIFVCLFAIGFALHGSVAHATPQADDERPTVLLIGSSSMRGVIGMGIQRAFRAWPSIQVEKHAQSSTGLARPDFFDWVAEAKKLNKKYRPKVVVCNLGPNDGQSLRDGKDWHYWGTDTWRELYMERVAAVVDAFPDATVIWLGPPTMRNENTSLRQALLALYIRTVVRTYSRARFIDLFALTSNSRGEYTDQITTSSGKRIVARTGDGIHFKMKAADTFAARVLSEALPALGLSLP